MWVRSVSRCYRPWNSRKIRLSLSLSSVKNAKILQPWVLTQILTLISSAGWSVKSQRYCRTVHCFQNIRKIRCSLSLFSVKNAKILQPWVLTQILTLISSADWSVKSQRYCRTVHCFQNIWFNKRTHPNEHRNGCKLSTKWVLVAAKRCAGKAVHILGN